MKLALAAFALLQMLATCAPPYNRPDAELPPIYREQKPQSTQQPSMGDLGWWQIFKDPQLQSLLRTAVANNYDTLVAAQRIQQAEAELTIVASNLYPQINAVLSAPYSQTNGSIPVTFPRSTFEPNGLLTLQYEIDLFGKVRSATAAARAQVLQSEFARETVLTTVVSSVATLYFQIRELDEELRITRETLVARELSLRLVRARLEGGIGTLQDVLQAQQLVAQAAAYIPVEEKTIAQTENALSILLGEYPHGIPRGLRLDQQIAMPEIPAAGMPSSLIERRPDIRESEEALIAANAQIGVAKALLFPQFTIGAAAGAGSSQISGSRLATLLRQPSSAWYGIGIVQIMPQIVQQVFNAGAARANVAQSEAAKEAALLQYVQTIHNGFGEVSNALVDYDKDKTYTIDQAAATAAALGSTRQATIRFRGGVTSYLEVLVSDTQSFTAEIALVQAQLNERLDLVQLYKSLGGGWQVEPQTAQTAPSGTPSP